MTWCVRKKIRLIVMPLWVAETPLFSNRNGLYLFERTICGSLCFCWNTKNTAKHAVTQNSEKSKHIPECNSSVSSIWIIIESQNISSWKGPIYQNSVCFNLIYWNYNRKLQRNYLPRNFITLTIQKLCIRTN